MCGRFSIHIPDLSRIGDEIGPTRSGIEHWEPRFNVAPSQLAPVVIKARGEQRLVRMSWGFVPHFTREAAGVRPINARSETAAKKPVFRDALRSHRCIVPATGYFEWQRQAAAPGQPKQPFWLHPRDGALLYMAGLWARWQPPEGPPQDTFAVVTRDAVGAPRDVHDRMPLALDRQQVATWLASDPLQDGWLEGVAKTTDAGDGLSVDAVNPATNKATFDDPSCIEPAAPARQLSLFL